MASDPAMSRPVAAGSIFSVPSGRPFLDCLARAILDGNLPRQGGRPPDPLELSSWTVLLPTRRAARGFNDAFLRVSAERKGSVVDRGHAMLLPRVRAVAESDEDQSLLSGLAGLETLLPGTGDLPAAVSEIERRLVLTRLVMQWSKALRRTDTTDDASSADPDGGMGLVVAAGAATPAQAAALALELGRLMDMVETENVSLSTLATLVPVEFSAHWQSTLDFLKIVLDWWPAYLTECGRIAPADRRNRLILAEAQRYATTPQRAPVIVAGVTGSIPASAALMRAVAALDQGAIVLPGLDQTLDAHGWKAVADHPEHPQFGLAKLISALGQTRDDVAILDGADPTPVAAVRATLLAEALRPASTTEHWRDFAETASKPDINAALDGVIALETASGQDEAEMISLILREALETPGRTAALVSPDRLLARRVAVRLEAWGIRVDDSAGRPFGKTVPGAFLDLVIDTVARRYEPTAVMALLKHPLTRLGLPAFDVRRAARALEIAAFRTIYLGDGMDGIETAIERAALEVETGARRERAVKRLWTEDWQIARELVQHLKVAFAPLDAVFQNRSDHALADLVRAHITTAEALCRLPEELPEPTLWRGEAGLAASTMLTGLLDPNLHAPAIATTDYPDFYRSLVAQEAVRARLPVHPRLSIWGPFEARLQQPDVVILGSLNEGTWPQAADPGPWLNRPMRKHLGLPSPEEAIGYAAHDVTMLLGGARVYLTRAQKIDGVPTVASRWLLRLNALLSGLELKSALKTDQPWLAWAQARDAISQPVQIAAPRPRPPLSLRPRQLSVSEVETMMANPYAIFASRILGLDCLPPLGQQPDASLRGSIVHQALGRFAERFPASLPDDPRAELLRLAEAVLADYTQSPRVAAFWVPRFNRFATWFAETEPGRRDGISRTLAEISGATILTAPAGPFTLKARADRIDVGSTGIIITDYKTGGDVKGLAGHAAKGEAPQLPLEAIIAIAGGFTHVDAGRVAGLRYISASGGEPAGSAVDVKSDDIAALSATAKAGLARLITSFDDANTPYAAIRRARFNYDYDDYAHLARVAEWSGNDDADGEGEA